MPRESHIMRYLLPVILLAAGVVYYVFDPRSDGVPFLKCPFHLLTGLQCPACGTQRAIHCLLHGEVMQAVNYNFFLIVSVPFVVLAVLAYWYNDNHRFDWAMRFVYDRRTLATYIVLFFVWWIVRNIIHI